MKRIHLEARYGRTKKTYPIYRPRPTPVQRDRPIRVKP